MGHLTRPAGNELMPAGTSTRMLLSLALLSVICVAPAASVRYMAPVATECSRLQSSCDTFACPKHSCAKADGPDCIAGIEDCECWKGFALTEDGQCAPETYPFCKKQIASAPEGCDFVCPENGCIKAESASCVRDSGDCFCQNGYFMSNGSCIKFEPWKQDSNKFVNLNPVRRSLGYKDKSDKCKDLKGKKKKKCKRKMKGKNDDDDDDDDDEGRAGFSFLRPIKQRKASRKSNDDDDGDGYRGARGGGDDDDDDGPKTARKGDDDDGDDDNYGNPDYCMYRGERYVSGRWRDPLCVCSDGAWACSPEPEIEGPAGCYGDMPYGLQQCVCDGNKVGEAAGIAACGRVMRGCDNSIIAFSAPQNPLLEAVQRVCDTMAMDSCFSVSMDVIVTVTGCAEILRSGSPVCSPEQARIIFENTVEGACQPLCKECQRR